MDLRPGVRVLLRFACMCDDIMDFVPGTFNNGPRFCFVAWILLEYYLKMVFGDDTRLHGICMMELIVSQ